MNKEKEIRRLIETAYECLDKAMEMLEDRRLDKSCENDNLMSLGEEDFFDNIYYSNKAIVYSKELSINTLKDKGTCTTSLMEEGGAGGGRVKCHSRDSIVRSLAEKATIDPERDALGCFRQQYARRFGRIPTVLRYGQAGLALKNLVMQHGGEDYQSRLTAFLNNPDQVRYGYEWQSFVRAFGLYAGGFIPTGRKETGSSHMQQAEKCVEAVNRLADRGVIGG